MHAPDERLKKNAAAVLTGIVQAKADVVSSARAHEVVSSGKAVAITWRARERCKMRRPMNKLTIICRWLCFATFVRTAAEGNSCMLGRGDNVVPNHLLARQAICNRVLCRCVHVEWGEDEFQKDDQIWGHTYTRASCSRRKVETSRRRPVRSRWY
jgi:hypothetical protein